MLDWWQAIKDCLGWIVPLIAGAVGYLLKTINKHDQLHAINGRRLDAIEERLKLNESNYQAINTQLTQLTILVTRLEERLKITLEIIEKRAHD